MNSYETAGAPEGSYGFKYKGTDFVTRYVAIKAVPLEVPQVLTKRLMIDFDEITGLIVKEVQ